MKFNQKIHLFLTAALWVPGLCWAGPYAPAAGEPGSTAVPSDDPAIVAWADGWEHYAPGAEVDAGPFADPTNALGPAEGVADASVVSLGRGGTITLTFDPPIADGPGWDFAVFENGFENEFLELAFVEISSDGLQFVRFDAVSLNPDPIPAFGLLDPTDLDGFAGKYRVGFGTPFDLGELSDRGEVGSGQVNLASISHVRFVDVVGDGTSTDSLGNPIFDPFPTVGSAGFDLDAVGVLNQATAAAPRPVIRAGGMDDRLLVSPQTPVSVTAMLDPGDRAGRDADWLVAMHTPLPPPDDWVILLFQYPLMAVGTVEILNGPLPPGETVFYFAVDDNADGVVNATWWDTVTVSVVP